MNLGMGSLTTLELALCAFMTGVIWIIQILHYPIFSAISVERLSTEAANHARKITWIVGPTMIAEAVVAALMIRSQPQSSVALANAVGVAATWASTFLLSVPLHEKLQAHPSEPTVRRLVLTNWPRTVLWSARAVLLAAAILYNG